MEAMKKKRTERIRWAAKALLEFVAENFVRALATTAVVWLAVFLVLWRVGVRAQGALSQTEFLALLAAIAATMAAGWAAAAFWFYYQRQKANAHYALQMLHLNHHVRNAMQVIAYSQARMPQAEAETVNHALKRISEALRTISNAAATVPEPPLQRTPMSKLKTIQSLQRGMERPYLPRISTQARPGPAKNT
jgi:hypothetical protein